MDEARKEKFKQVMKRIGYGLIVIGLIAFVMCGNFVITGTVPVP